MHDAIEELRPASGVFERCRAMPITVRLYLAFALGAFALQLSQIYAKSLHEWLIQWTGWGGLLCYVFGTFTIGGHLLTGSTNGVRRLPILMAAFAVFGAYEYISPVEGAERFTETNPYLRVHPWQPLVTVVVPALWALVLYLGSKQWLARSDAEPAAEV